MTFGLAPRSNIKLAKVCLKSWKRTLPRPANGLEGYHFTVEIMDNTLNVLNSSNYPLSKLTETNPTWVEFYIPDVEVNDKFYVHMYPKESRPFPW